MHFITASVLFLADITVFVPPSVPWVESRLVYFYLRGMQVSCGWEALSGLPQRLKCCLAGRWWTDVWWQQSRYCVCKLAESLVGWVCEQMICVCACFWCVWGINIIKRAKYQTMRYAIHMQHFCQYISHRHFRGHLACNETHLKSVQEAL